MPMSALETGFHNGIGQNANWKNLVKTHVSWGGFLKNISVGIPTYSGVKTSS